MVSAQSAVLPSAVPAVSAPTRLRLPDLLHATDRHADDVLSGRYDHLREQAFEYAWLMTQVGITN